MSQPIPTWYPQHPPIYDINLTYQQNFDDGPFFDGTIPQRDTGDKSKWVDFLGYKIASPIGVPAGPLLNSKFIALAAKLGFDIVTYKTIRSQVFPCHPLPNVIYADTKGQLNPSDLTSPITLLVGQPASVNQLTITNSFGIPSRDSDFLLADIKKANDSLADGQVMIVSTTGTHRPGEDFVKDFADVAVLAQQAGAKIVESNFSCPNLSGDGGSLYTDASSVLKVGKKIVAAIKDTPLIIKVGHFTDKGTMVDVLKAIAQCGAQAVCGLNAVSMKVLDDQGNPALDENRITSGVCGSAIRDLTLDFVSQANEINNKEKLGLTILGVGGVTLPQHFDDLLKAGADVALTATGMMWDPYLATRYHNLTKIPNNKL